MRYLAGEYKNLTMRYTMLFSTPFPYSSDVLQSEILPEVLQLILIIGNFLNCVSIQLLLLVILGSVHHSAHHKLKECCLMFDTGWVCRKRCRLQNQLTFKDC